MNTRKYSSSQEKKVAKKVGGKQVANSGATAFHKGDVRTNQFLIECKTSTKEVKSVRIQKDWLDKIDEEAFAIYVAPKATTKAKLNTVWKAWGLPVRAVKE